MYLDINTCVEASGQRERENERERNRERNSENEIT